MLDCVYETSVLFQVFVSWCEGLSTDYLVGIFERLNWVSMQTMMTSGRFDEVSYRIADLFVLLWMVSWSTVLWESRGMFQQLRTKDEIT